MFEKWKCIKKKEETPQLDKVLKVFLKSINASKKEETP